MEDDDIRAALRSGDFNVAFRLLVRAHGPAVYSTCCRILKNRPAAEDVMQQAMMTVFKRRSKLHEMTHIRGWLISIAVHKSLDALRSSKRQDRLQLHVANTNAPYEKGLLEQLVTAQDKRALEECIAALDPKVAAVVLMRYRHEMSWEDIGATVGSGPDAVRMAVSRGALRSLRDCLAAKESKP